MFSWTKIKKPFIGLAPMADYTDSPFSLICKKFNVDVIYREMVSAEALARGSVKTLEMARFDKRERPIILQIFGKDPAVMAEAARILEEKYLPDGIDINMGCPAKKIISDFNGASLMRDPKLAAAIVRAVKDAVRLPVSVKTRLGWDKETEILKFAPILEEAGADALAVHCRTKKAGYSGQADWKVLWQVKEKISLPLLVNGDITDFLSFEKAIKESNADGALVARGALGNPWIFKNIKKKKNAPPLLQELKKIILEHAKLHLVKNGERGMVTFRKHLVAYFKGQKNASKIREQLVRLSSFNELENFLSKIL